jgi:hypothetical protein
MRRPSWNTAVINFNSAGDNTVIAAPANGPINVYSLFFTVTTATNITFKAGSTALSGVIDMTGAGSAMLLRCPRFCIRHQSIGNGLSPGRGLLQRRRITLTEPLAQAVHEAGLTPCCWAKICCPECGELRASILELPSRYHPCPRCQGQASCGTRRRTAEVETVFTPVEDDKSLWLEA